MAMDLKADMSPQNLQSFAILLCFLIGLSLGLLGSGGSILTVPILVYLLHVDAKEAIAMSLVVVGVTSASALISHARSGNVNWKMGAIFGMAGMAGALLGGIIAGYISEHVLMLIFAGMTLATATAMLCKDTAAAQYQAIPAVAHDENDENDENEPSENEKGEDFSDSKEASGASGYLSGPPLSPSSHNLPLWRILLDGFLVGMVTGMVGAGGGFLVVPALVFLGGLQMTEAIGTSLMVISMKCFAGYIGHASHAHIDLHLTILVTVSAVVGSFAGGFCADLLPQAVLRKAFAVFVLVIGTLQLWKESTELKAWKLVKGCQKHQPLNHQMRTACLFGTRNAGIHRNTIQMIFLIQFADQLWCDVPIISIYFDSVLLRLAKQDMKLDQPAVLEASSSKQKWHLGLVEALHSTDCLGGKCQYVSIQILNRLVMFAETCRYSLSCTTCPCLTSFSIRWFAAGRLQPRRIRNGLKEWHPKHQRDIAESWSTLMKNWSKLINASHIYR